MKGSGPSITLSLPERPTLGEGGFKPADVCEYVLKGDYSLGESKGAN